MVLFSGQSARDARDRDAIALLHEQAEPLPRLDTAEFAACFDRFGSARIVMLGEATHGTSEFYRARAAITRRLIERHGFNIVAVEADWPDAATLDHYVRRRPLPTPSEPPFRRFPVWMWRNAEFHDFVDFLRSYNETLPIDRRVAFRGLDIYSLFSSMAAVVGYLDRVDPERAHTARERYGCLTPWQSDPTAYGRAVMAGRDSCEDAVVIQLRHLLESGLAERDEAFFDAAQNGRIVRAAEHYYRIMYRGSTEAWNLRDRHMYETLRAVMQHHGPHAKAVVWAHNSHIGNAAATAMGWAGEFNVGELTRHAYGEDAVLIGFGTDRGTVAAADDWGGDMRIKSVRPSRDDSYEGLFRRTGVPAMLIDWRPPGRRDLRDVLTGPRLERAIGVVYRPDSEFLSHYFEAVLPDQYDAFVWLETTAAITPSSLVSGRGAADLYPFGF